MFCSLATTRSPSHRLRWHLRCHHRTQWCHWGEKVALALGSHYPMVHGIWFKRPGDYLVVFFMFLSAPKKSDEDSYSFFLVSVWVLISRIRCPIYPKESALHSYRSCSWKKDSDLLNVRSNKKAVLPWPSRATNRQMMQWKNTMVASLN